MQVFQKLLFYPSTKKAPNYTSNTSLLTDFMLSQLSRPSQAGKKAAFSHTVIHGTRKSPTFNSQVYYLVKNTCNKYTLEYSINRAVNSAESIPRISDSFDFFSL